MQDRSAILQPVKRGLDVGLERSKRSNRIVLGYLGVVGRDVELGPVARRETDGLATALGKPCGELLRRVTLERDPLPELYRRVVVRGAYEDEADHPK
jgi:hypothetical protein